MKTYGLKRNWNATEDYKHRRSCTKMLHRRARRIAKNLLKIKPMED